MSSSSTRKSRVVPAAFVLFLVASAFPASATLLTPPATTSNTSAVSFCSPQTGGIHAGEAALLAACAGIKLANGDFDGADAAAISAARLLYGDAAPPRVLETYAHEYAFLQNPVLNPGFEIDETHPYSSPHAGFWTGDYSMADGKLSLSDAQSATQLFGAAASDASSNTGIGESFYWGPHTLSLDYSGAGTANVLLGETSTGTEWPITVTLPTHAAFGHATFDLLQAYGGTTVLLNSGESRDVKDALHESALVSITILPSPTLVVDNLALAGAAYGPQPSLAINLDDPSGSNDDVGRALGIARGMAPVDKPLAITLPAHDGVSTLIVPLAFAPTLLAGTSTTDPGAIAQNAPSAASGTWTLFVAAIQHTASGPRVLTPTGGSVSLDGGALGTAVTPNPQPFGSIGPLASQGATGKLYAQLLATQGLDGVTGGVVSLDVDAARSVFVHADVTTDVGTVSGYYNSAKLVHPASAFNDALDVVSDSLYGERQALSAGLYATQRHADTNDGVLGMIRPHGAVPLNGGVSADTLLLPDPAGNYDIDVSFVDYHGAPVQGSYAYVTFFSPEGLTKAAASNWNGEWYNLAEFRACSQPLHFTTCEFSFDPAGTDGVYHVPIAGKVLQQMKTGLGGRLFPVAFLHVNGATPDRELLNTIPGRAAYNPVVNGIADMATTFGIGAGEANVGPYWLYAAADAISMAGNPLAFAPASDAADGYAVLIHPAGDPKALSPDANGYYEFNVKFPAYENGAAIRDAVIDPQHFRLHLTDAKSQADVISGGHSLWNSASPGAIVEQIRDSYDVRVPAWEIPTQTDAANASIQDAVGQQALTAWAALWHPAYAQNGEAVKYPTDDNANLIGGFYNPLKNQLAANAIADQMDNTPAPLVLNRTKEVYNFTLSGPTNFNLDRGTQTIPFTIANTGAFNDHFTLDLSKTGFDAVFADSNAASLTLLVPAGSTLPVPITVTVSDPTDNGALGTLDVTARLAHAMRPGVTLPDQTIQAALKVDPLTYSVVKKGDLTLKPSDLGSAVFTVKNDASSVVSDSFVLSPGVSDAQLKHPTLSPATTDLLRPGASQDATVSFAVDGATHFGLTKTVTLTATPTHKGVPASDIVTVHIPDSSLKITSEQANDQTGVKPGDTITYHYTATYVGPYTETFDLTTVHNILASAQDTIKVDGSLASKATFVGGGSLPISVEFVVPLGTPTNTIDVLTLTATNTNPTQSNAKDAAQSQISLVKAALTAAFTSVDHYGLPGDTLTYDLALKYTGEVGWTFDLSATQPNVLGNAPQFSPATITFLSGTSTQQIAVTATLNSGANYADVGTITVTATPRDAAAYGGTVPKPTATAGVFSLMPPTPVFDTSPLATFPKDVKVTHTAAITLAALPASQQADWDARTVKTVTFDLTPAHSRSSEWSDDLLNSVSIAPGGSNTVDVVSMPMAASGTDDLTLTATSHIVPLLTATSNVAHTRIFTDQDFVVHTILVGCYGTDATTCTRVGGPIQAVTTHDVPDATYSRGYLVSSLVQVTNASAPVFLNDSMDVTVTLTSIAVDANVGDLSLVSNAPSLGDADGTFSYLAAGSEIVAFPKIVDLPGTQTHTGTTTLLWDTTSRPEAVTWLLHHLGTTTLGVKLDVHGLPLIGDYSAAEQMFPVSGTDAKVSGVGTAVFLTDKDDPDGDGYATVSELRGNSNPLLKSSTPYTDDDHDGFVNIRDIIGFVNEQCLVKDIQDPNWDPCGLPVTVPNPTVPGVLFGPPEVAHYIQQIVAAYNLPREGP